MPFKSEKQRRYLFANDPELAKKWSNMYKNKIVGLGGMKKHINEFIEDYSYYFSADEDRMYARIYDALDNDPKKFKKYVTDYNSKIDEVIKTIKKDSKIAKKKGVFYNEKGLLEDITYYNLDGTISKSKKITGLGGVKSKKKSKKLTYSDFVDMVRADMRAGSSSDENAFKNQIERVARWKYDDYLKGVDVKDLF